MFSAELEARLADLARRYPPGYRRAALVPMLLYIQDEVGAITDEVVEDVARRLNLTALQVHEVVGYYSMLRRQPAGRHHIQVCTNISCMLRGGDRLYEHVKQRLSLGHKETSADGTFSLEEVECIGACCWGPAIQVNYEFHHHVTPARFDELLERLKSGGKASHSTQPRLCITIRTLWRSAFSRAGLVCRIPPRSILIWRTMATKRSRRSSSR